MATVSVRRVLSGCALLLTTALSWAPFAASLDAQSLDLRFVAIDMYGGPVWASDSDPGVAFGGRFGFADMFGRAVHAGLELDWWTAERRDADLEVRDALGGLAFWTDIGQSGALRPFVGLAAALHSIDASRKDGGSLQVGELPQAQDLDGLRFGGSGFGGVTLRLSGTGAIWLIAEYRYSVVSNLSNHELRAGLRLRGSDP